MEVEGTTIQQQYDVFGIFVSFWTAVTGTYTAVQVLNRLIIVYRFYIAVHAKELSRNLPKDSRFKMLYIYYFLNKKLFFYLFLTSLSFGACGIWGMHFCAMYALKIVAFKTTERINYAVDPYSDSNTLITKEIEVFYDIYQTFFSLIVAVIAVYCGMIISALGSGMLYLPSDKGKLGDILRDYGNEEAKKMVSDMPMTLLGSLLQRKKLNNRLSIVAKPESDSNRNSITRSDLTSKKKPSFTYSTLEKNENPSTTSRNKGDSNKISNSSSPTIEELNSVSREVPNSYNSVQKKTLKLLNSPNNSNRSLSILNSIGNKTSSTSATNIYIHLNGSKNTFFARPEKNPEEGVAGISNEEKKNVEMKPVRPLLLIQDEEKQMASHGNKDKVGVVLNLQKICLMDLNTLRKAMFILGCVVTGLGVSAMHFSGVAAMNTAKFSMIFRWRMVLVASALGVIVATVGLWILFFLKGPIPRFICPVIIAVAVLSMHYVGMYAMNFKSTTDPFETDYNLYIEELPRSMISGRSINLIRNHFSYTIQLIIIIIIQNVS
ncbi:hypothetical protein HK099_004350 [Clydaea vesicula]|uniref:MHYT domain-containing protein n=1 Tax=Clydaea vesicula TaxID=447962 RepID=A0AAD5U3S6_9FUNG|nr:hypothetical protein HK099_004350 [Clydaea vesicula]